MQEKAASTKKVEIQAKAEIKKVRSSLNLDLDIDLSLSRAAIPLCMASVFGFFKLVDELLEFIEFVWSDVLKGDSKFVSSNPLHTCIFD